MLSSGMASTVFGYATNISGSTDAPGSPYAEDRIASWMFLLLETSVTST